MKKILLIIILLAGCQKQTEKLTTSSIVIADNISGVVTKIDESTIEINRENEIYTFELSDIDVSDIDINDEVSIVYNIKNDEITVVSIILEKKTSDTTLKEGIGIIQKGTTYENIIVLIDDEVITLQNYDVEIRFEGNLVENMKVKVSYDSKNVLKSIDILE